MSLELFFVTRTPSFEALRDPDFAPSPAQRKLRQKLVTELLADYAGTELRGEPLNGWIDGLPGTLQLQPGYLLWSLKGIDGDADIDMVQGVIDWFAARALICEDPQDAGFGNRRPRQGEKLTLPGAGGCPAAEPAVRSRLVDLADRGVDPRR